MNARSAAGLYLTVALGLAMTPRDDIWESTRISVATPRSFALIALLSTVHVLTPSPGMTAFERPFTGLWFFLDLVSAMGGFCYQLPFPRSHGPVGGILRSRKRKGYTPRPIPRSHADDAGT